MNADFKSSNTTHDKLVFLDKKPPLNSLEATVESNRCYFCYDAPCVEACPTNIDIPSFIRKISTGNLKGSAIDILTQNIMGGTCARVCPVESLCEKSCVRNASEDKPVAIGLLQRYSTDWLFEHRIQPFEREKPTGKNIAIIGAGPAGLSCAHRLAMLGHQVTIFEAKAKPGGLNEYGLAAYKVVNNFVQKEIDFILQIGGIDIQYEKILGKNIHLKSLRQEYHAVFLASGLSAVNALHIEGEDLPGVIDAVEYIAKIRQQKDISTLSVGKNIVVIGGGNTAIDVAVQSKLLGAEHVTLLYRRGQDAMSATWVEQLLAKKSDVTIRYWSAPVKIQGDQSGVREVIFEKTILGKSGSLERTGHYFSIPCDTVFKAIGQLLSPEDLGDAPEFLKIEKGRIVVDDCRRTTLSNVFSGGDCTNGGQLTVIAVQDGKIAALHIHRMLMEQKSHG